MNGSSDMEHEPNVADTSASEAEYGYTVVTGNRPAKQTRTTGPSGSDTDDSTRTVKTPRPQSGAGPVPLLLVKIPPIVLDELGSNWPTFLSWMRDEGFEFEAKFTGGRLHIISKSDTHFRSIQAYLKRKQMTLHTFSLQEDQEVKAVLRGIPHGTNPDLISAALQDLCLTSKHVQPRGKAKRE